MDSVMHYAKARKRKTVNIRKEK